LSRSGWAIPRFGWFGLKEEDPSNLAMNYIGVVLAMLSAIFYLFVKPETVNKHTDQGETEPLILRTLSVNTIMSNESFFDRLNPNLKRTVGAFLAIFSGTENTLPFYQTIRAEI
jgi:hypothetical protein